MKVVLLGGPLHRKRKMVEDNKHFLCIESYSRKITNILQFDFQNNYDIINVTKNNYIRLNGVKYYNGETIFVHEKFDIKKSKIINKLETTNLK